jgi:hypothetical protein
MRAAYNKVPESEAEAADASLPWKNQRFSLELEQARKLK